MHQRPRAPQVLVASGSYIEERGEPVHPSEPGSHNCLVHLLSAPDGVWRFTKGTEEIDVRVDGSIKSELGESIRSAAAAGLGVSIHPAFMVAADIHSGRIRQILPEWNLEHMSIQAVYPSGRHLPARTRALLDFLQDWFFKAGKLAISRRLISAEPQPH